MGEKEVENQILHWLNSRRWCFAWKNNSTGIWDEEKQIFRRPNNRFLIRGVPDILGFTDGGLFLGIEVKSEKGVISDAQNAFISKAFKMKTLVFVARSLLEVQVTLRERDSGWV